MREVEVGVPQALTRAIFNWCETGSVAEGARWGPSGPAPFLGLLTTRGWAPPPPVPPPRPAPQSLPLHRLPKRPQAQSGPPHFPRFTSFSWQNLS